MRMADVLAIMAVAVGVIAVLGSLVVLCCPKVKIETKHKVMLYGTLIAILDGVFVKLAGIRLHVPQRAAPFIAAIVLSGAVIYFVWYFPRARSLARHWAARNGFEILDLKHRWLFKGPYFWDHTRYQPVFRVRVRDCHGEERSGWVRCGGGLTGVFTDEASVIWDDDKRT